MGTNKDCPCSQCPPPVRHLGCHGDCEGYKAWRTKLEGIRAKEREEDPYFAHLMQGKAKRLHKESRNAK